ncbi:hypothetical protein VNO80_11501 [Phaseolus coccineus]|uniref:Uncharacterized protein n=1 Tax=Phaseolus coccineus TaxID=3886 RepID=A0AAN9NAK3_PHACN
MWLKEVGFEVERGKDGTKLRVGDLNLWWSWRVDVAGDLYLAVAEAVFFQCPSSAHKPFRMGHAFGAQCFLPVPSNASFMQAMDFLSASFSLCLHFTLLALL